MQVKIQGILLEVETKNYEIDGKKGTTHKLVIYNEGTLYKVSVPLSRVQEFNAQQGEVVEVWAKLFIKGSYSLKLAE